MRTKTDLAILATPPFAEVEAALAACQGELAGLVFRQAEVAADGVRAFEYFTRWGTSPMGELSGCRVTDGLCAGCRDACPALNAFLDTTQARRRQLVSLGIMIQVGHAQLGQLVWYERQRRRGRPDTWRTETARRYTAYYSQYAAPGCAAIVCRPEGGSR